MSHPRGTLATGATISQRHGNRQPCIAGGPRVRDLQAAYDLLALTDPDFQPFEITGGSPE
jgi:hypothetical protein